MTRSGDKHGEMGRLQRRRRTVTAMWERACMSAWPHSLGGSTDEQRSGERLRQQKKTQSLARLALALLLACLAARLARQGWVFAIETRSRDSSLAPVTEEWRTTKSRICHRNARRLKYSTLPAYSQGMATPEQARVKETGPGSRNHKLCSHGGHQRVPLPCSAG